METKKSVVFFTLSPVSNPRAGFEKIHIFDIVNAVQQSASTELDNENSVTTT